MSGAIVNRAKAGDRFRIVDLSGNVEIVTLAGPFTSDGIAWHCSALLTGPGCPVLFYQCATSKRSTWQMRRDDADGTPARSLYDVSASPVTDNPEPT